MKLLVLISFVCLFAPSTFGASIGVNLASRLGKSLDTKEPIDTDKKYYLGWSVDEEKQEITFEVEVETTGYVGFGLSPSGSMKGADLFIAGVYPNKTSYYGDYYATDNAKPTLDVHQDWNLINATEDGNHTTLRFSRLLDTCDTQDFPINGDTSRVIWSYGSTDELLHHAERGTVSANLLMPDQPFDPEEYQFFDTMSEIEMPPEDTSYWCTLHKGQKFDQKHHLIAFEPHLPDELAERFTHHIVLHNCVAPDGEDPDDFFEKHLDKHGYCDANEDEDRLPYRSYCREQTFVWAKGGKRMVFPDDIGFPIGEIANKTLYYMLEVHYDNPKMEANHTFSTGLRTYYTDKPRNIEAGLMIIGHQVNPSTLVPPKTKDFIVAGHCASECTKKHLPEDGIFIFNNLLHAHLSGRKLKLRHFRNGEELPWADVDENYDFNFQQNKPFRDFVKVLPGDHLTYECTYDSTWNEKGEAVVGGFSTRDEMCESFVWYYPKTELSYCSSSYPVDQGMEDFGITNYTQQTIKGNPSAYIYEPKELEGPFVDSISFKFKNWTVDYIKEFQQKRRFGEHDITCFTSQTVKYPEFKTEYVPDDKCKNSGTNIFPSAILMFVGISALLSKRTAINFISRMMTKSFQSIHPTTIRKPPHFHAEIVGSYIHPTISFSPVAKREQVQCEE